MQLEVECLLMLGRRDLFKMQISWRVRALKTPESAANAQFLGQFSLETL